MNQVVLKYKENIIETITIGLLLLLSLYRTAGHAFWLVLSGRGLPKSSDSYWYINYACGLLENFSIGLGIDEVLYLGYNLLLAALLSARILAAIRRRINSGKAKNRRWTQGL